MENRNVKQRVINLVVNDVLAEKCLLDKKNAAPQDIIAALSLFERDGLQVIVQLDTIDISAGSSSSII